MVVQPSSLASHLEQPAALPDPNRRRRRRRSGNGRAIVSKRTRRKIGRVLTGMILFSLVVAITVYLAWLSTYEAAPYLNQ